MKIFKVRIATFFVFNLNFPLNFGPVEESKCQI